MTFIILNSEHFWTTNSIVGETYSYIRLPSKIQLFLGRLLESFYKNTLSLEIQLSWLWQRNVYDENLEPLY